MRSPVMSTVHEPPVSPKSTATDSLKASDSQQLPLLHLDGVQNLCARRLLSPQSQTEVTIQTVRGCLSRQQQDTHGDGLTARPLTHMQTVTNHSQQRMCAANHVSKTVTRMSSSAGNLHGVNPEVAALVSPRQQVRTIRDSPLMQTRSTLMPSHLHPAYRKGASIPGLPQPLSHH